ncbi:MAG: hypothetical protein B6245_06490 [Desulfobacteraceae bacterium 4572_88]|nr:MAG: hypothetical protein B6245_06490 [Desulfobacteraceae bacterium 4572_88]
MEKLTREQELDILNKCLNDCSRCDDLIRQYHRLIADKVRKTFFSKKVSFTEQDVEDMVSETWLALFNKNCEKLRKYDSEKGSLATWLWTIACQTTIANLRGKKDCLHLENRNKRNDFEKAAELLNDGKNTLTAIECKETRVLILEECLRELTSQERLVVKLHFFDDLSLREIAEIQNRDVSLIYPPISRARKKIRECVKKKEQA